MNISYQLRMKDKEFVIEPGTEVHNIIKAFCLSSREPYKPLVPLKVEFYKVLDDEDDIKNQE